MPGRPVVRHYCNKCGELIEDKPELGDRQGGKRQIVHMATTWELWLCEQCAEPLFELYQEYADVARIAGTVIGVEALRYLPRGDVDNDGAGVEPPRFSEGQ